MMLEKIDDFEPEPDDHADAVFDEASEIAGLHVRLLIGITEYAYSHADDKDALDAIKMVFKWNPKHLIRAYERSPWAFKYENADSLSWEDVVATWTIGKTNDNLRAAEIEDQWRSHTLTLAELRDAVKAANGTREKRATLAERCAERVREWRRIVDVMDQPVEAEERRALRLCSDQIAALPEVAKALEAKDAA